MDEPKVSIHSIARRSPSADRLLFGQPVKAAPVHIAASMRPQEAFRAILSDCAAQIMANAAALRAGRSVEGLHQLRVAFRRLDVALGAFGREFGQDWLEELRGRAKILFARLSHARDMDVFVGELIAAVPDARSEGHAALRRRADDVRDRAWQTALEGLGSEDFEKFADDIAALAASQLPLARDRRLPRTAARILNRQLRRVSKRGKTARSQEEKDLHRLRIALKKLRYTAEFFAPLYDKNEVKRYLKTLRGLQNHLGRLNDVANVRAVVGTLMRPEAGDQGGLRFAAGMVVGWYDAQVPVEVRAALKRYRKFRKITPFWA